MSQWEISFPNLGLHFPYVPKGFTVFGLEIAMYGLVIALAMFCGLALARALAVRAGQDPEMVADFALYAIFFSIVGARLYYVAFSFDDYKDNLLSILYLRQGGLAIYGGIIGGFATLFLYARIKRLDPFLLGDLAVPGLCLGQILGRFGNFFNREAFGGAYGGLLAMRLPVSMVRPQDIPAALAESAQSLGYIDVHPTFLYESLWNLVLLVILLYFWSKKRYNGQVCLWYFMGYGLGRFFIESLRTDQLLLPGTDMAVSMVLSAILALAAFGGNWLCLWKKAGRERE